MSTIVCPLISSEIKWFKILIVEDRSIYRRVLKDNLAMRFPFIIIEEAANGKEALEKVETFLPDLIFMDIHLPGKNGIQLTREIKKNHPDITIIVLTSEDSQKVRQAAFEAGASCFSTKDSLDLEVISPFMKFHFE